MPSTLSCILLHERCYINKVLLLLLLLLLLLILILFSLLPNTIIIVLFLSWEEHFGSSNYLFALNTDTVNLLSRSQVREGERDIYMCIICVTMVINVIVLYHLAQRQHTDIEQKRTDPWGILHVIDTLPDSYNCQW